MKEALKVGRLRTLCFVKGLKVSGNKAELAERIDTYDNQRLPEELCVDSLMKLYLHCVCFHMSDFFEQVHLIIAIFLFTSYLNIDYHSVRFQERIN